ncbi:hypothetical protein [Microbacterium sp. MTN4-26]|uniref:hypothetical protein n=1 Tax=unclassified Microbacterium TaxID=2609290 RepID=UPI0036F2D236
MDDDLDGAQPRCPSCGVLMRDERDGFRCPACATLVAFDAAPPPPTFDGPSIRGG